MIDLCTLQDAKEHLHLVGNRYDADIQTKILQASMILLNFLKVDVDASPLSVPWGNADVPWDIHAACVLLVGRLSKERESDEPILNAGIKDLLRRWRDPAMT